MLKNYLKLATIGLLLICILAVPVFGFSLYDSPSIFKENALFTNRQLGGGTSVYLSFAEEENNITDEDYQTAAKILKERFLAMGYSDVDTSVDSKLIRVDVPQKTYIDSVFAQNASVGSWSFVGSNLTDVVCDSSMVQDAYVVANQSGSFSVTIEFTEEGAKKFASNVSSYASSSAYIYLMLDGQFTASATVDTSSVKSTFTFGSYAQSSASSIATYIKHGELPGTVVIEKTEPLAPDFSSGVITAIAGGFAAIFLACCVLLFIKGSKGGLFGAFVLLSDVAILAVAVANGSFVLDLATIISAIVLLILSTLLMANILPVFKSPVVDMKKLAKKSIRYTWIHAIAIAVAITALFFVKGQAIYVVRCAMTFICANFATYFTFVYFGANTLSDISKTK